MDLIKPKLFNDGLKCICCHERNDDEKMREK